MLVYMIEQAIKLSMRNKTALESVAKAGCYQCLEIYETKEIKEWTDQGQTALCPKCHVDSVIPSSSFNELTKEKLEEIKKYWFD